MDVQNEFRYEYIEDDLGEIKYWEQFPVNELRMRKGQCDNRIETGVKE